jgi:uncharacterized protein (DUF58 family)
VPPWWVLPLQADGTTTVLVTNACFRHRSELIGGNLDARLRAVRVKFANSLKSPAGGHSAVASLPWFPGSAEVWIRFLGALLGLGLAFGAALFSTVFRDSGNVWATVGLASLSLLLAVAVGLATVPYLARRAAAERQRLRFEYHVTWVGGGYVLTTVVIAIAALNTGNNLLYIVVSAMLAAILVSGVASTITLRGVRLDVHLPERMFAGQPAQARIVLRNAKRWLPSLSLQVVAAKPSATQGETQWQWEESSFAFPPRSWRRAPWFRIPDRRLRRAALRPPMPGIFDGMVYFPVVRAGAEVAARRELIFPRRGRYAERGFAVATRFPFAFFTKTLNITLDRQVLVYPQLVPLEEFRDFEASIRGARDAASAGEGSDLYRIRDYQAGDSARQLDWKASAKSSTLMVREFSREDEPKLRILFDNPAAGSLSSEDYERLVSVAASFAWQSSQSRSDTSFVGPSSQVEQDVYGFLAELASLQPADSNGGTAFDWAGMIGRSPQDVWNVIVTSRADIKGISPELHRRLSVVRVFAAKSF